MVEALGPPNAGSSLVYREILGFSSLASDGDQAPEFMFLPSSHDGVTDWELDQMTKLWMLR